TSAGGHLVAMLQASGDVKELEGDLGKHQGAGSRVTCAVDFFGPTELLTMGKGPRIDHDAAGSPESKLVGGPLQETKNAAKQASPITHVSKDDPPILIIHGGNDPLVPYDQSVRFHAAHKKAGVESILIQMTGGGHGGFRNRELDARVQAFLDKHLRGVDSEISDKPIQARRRR
ncbi:MAG: S9 family peptidase, partial [Planctomycetales bacterium]